MQKFRELGALPQDPQNTQTLSVDFWLHAYIVLYL